MGRCADQSDIWPVPGHALSGPWPVCVRYLGLGFVEAAALLFFFPLAIAMGSLGIWLIELPLQIVGAIHGAILARNRGDEMPLPRYSRWYFLVAIHVVSLITVLVPAVILRTYFYQPFNTVSESMAPTLDAATYFWVSKRAYDEAGPQRGDLVVFHWTDGDYVKRVVAIPDDKVQMLGGQLFLNGKIVVRQRTPDVEMADEYGVVRPIRQYQETLPSGRSYKTLDLVDNSPQDNTPVFAVPAGAYVVLGDNRDSSNDSRLDVGFVPRANIVGEIEVKFADRRHKTMIWEPVN